MKALSNLDLRGNKIIGVSQVLDVNGNPLGGAAFKLYEDTFDSSDVTDTDSESDSGGNYTYYKYITISGSEHGVANPIVQLFETVSGVDKLINVIDIDIDESTYDVTFKFVSDENYNVADWENDTVYYKFRILGVDAASAGSGSGSGNGN